MKFTSISSILTLFILFSCSDIGKNEKHEVDASFKGYWYNNEAEVSRYNLSQARYGELHRGTAVLIFVTEPFSIENNTKSDNPNESDVPVLKLNFEKKFNTGVYPYSMMTSSFYPLNEGAHSLKVSSSSQEWCGHTYTELVNKEKYELSLNSYFEGESFSDLQLEKQDLEDDIWSQIRVDPNSLKIGKAEMIPSFFYLRLGHKEFKSYSCEISLSEKENTSTYLIKYSDLNRALSIDFEPVFPHKILSWSETYMSGWGEGKKELTTTATLTKTIKSDYWNKNKVKDTHLSKRLGLKD